MRIKSSKKAKSRKAIIAKLDKLARAMVFERDKDRCVRCGSTSGLQWSHVHSRRHYSIRWEMDNGKVLCIKCHCWWTNNPIEAAFWFSQNFPLRWEHVNELLRTSKPVKNHELIELLESMTDPPKLPMAFDPDACKDLPF